MITWKAPGSMSIYDVVELKNQLMTEHNMPQTLTLDLSSTLEIDTAGIQLLAWLRSMYQQHDYALNLINANANVMSCLALLGLDPLVYMDE